MKNMKIGKEFSTEISSKRFLRARGGGGLEALSYIKIGYRPCLLIRGLHLCIKIGYSSAMY